MDLDDAVPPPIRRSSQQPLQWQHVLQGGWPGEVESDDAAPPPIIRLRAASSSNSAPSKPSPRLLIPPLPNKSPLRSRPSLPPSHLQRSTRHARNFSHPFKQQTRCSNRLPQSNTPNPLAYHNNPRLPPSLRRWSSLETIESVTTTLSLYDDSPQQSADQSQGQSGELLQPDVETSSTGFSTLDEEDSSSSYRYSTHSGAPSLTHSDETSSLRSTSTPTRRSHVHANPTSSSLIRKLKPSRFKEPLVLPEHLEIERTISFDQTSHRSNSSNSIMTISSSRPSNMGYPSSTTASKTSQDSKDWRASDYDITSLSEKELKKCKKKGINPALYAEMKAARKGKWVSPIGGNTIL